MSVSLSVKSRPSSVSLWALVAACGMFVTSGTATADDTNPPTDSPVGQSAPSQVYRDVPFRQELATLYRNEVPLAEYELRTVRADRDGKVLINTNHGLLKAYDDRLVRYHELAGIESHDHLDLELLKGKFVFLTDKLFFPLHGAGRDFAHNADSGFRRVAAIAPGKYVLLAPNQLVIIDGDQRSELEVEGFQDLVIDPRDGSVVLYAADRLARFQDGRITKLAVPTAPIRGVAPIGEMDHLALATDDGLWLVKGNAVERDPRRLPVKELTAIAADSDQRLWIGSTRGAFCLERDGSVHYYAGRRWLHDDKVLDVHLDMRGDVYLLTAGGLTKLAFQLMTLADKAAIYQKHLRLNHIRYGLVSDAYLPEADYAQIRLHDSDNDGLWSSMYLASECFRYAASQDQDALENALDGFDAIEQLVKLPTIPGFQARTFELKGFASGEHEKWRERPQKDFDWKGHTSSDELVGTFFFHAVFFETMAKDQPELAARVRHCVCTVVDHILDHDLYLIDIDGKPTLWGRWNPEYVNTPEVGGDRRLNSIEILSFLQLAYRVSGDEKYRREFEKLVTQHGYAQNTVNYLPHPMGRWNHSDDELYWLSYFNLLRLCFDDSLRETFVKSARAHAEVCSRKRNPLWNFIYGVGTQDKIDLDGAAFVLREFPLDLRRWRMQNSHRLDVDQRGRARGRSEAMELLPPDERAMHKWNGNEMSLDGGGDGQSAESGAEFLLPYWMGRWAGYISPPVRDEKLAEAH